MARGEDFSRLMAIHSQPGVTASAVATAAVLEEGSEVEIVSPRLETATANQPSASLSTKGDSASLVILAASLDAPTMSEAVATKEQALETTTLAEPSKPRRRTTLGEIAAGKSLVQTEQRERGAVTWRTYMSYMRAGGGIFLGVVLLVLFALSAGAKGFSDWWLGYWIGQGGGSDNPDGGIQDNPRLDTYTLVYGMSAVLILFIQVVRAVAYIKSTLHASSRLHWKVFNSIVYAPMSFFDSTPTGRVINRFSHDLDDVDVQLPFGLETLLQNMMLILVALVLTAMVFPWFMLALVPIFIFYFYVVRYFSPVQRELKRLDNISRSPVLSLLTATFQGLPTIHAFQKSLVFRRNFSHLLNNNSECFYAFWVASRWFAFRLDFVTIAMICTVAFLSVGLRGTVAPELIGLALLYTSSVSGMFQFTTRQLAEVEARFTSVERINNYIEDVPQEASAVLPKTDPPDEWPQHGKIELRELEVRYRPELPLVLDRISLSIEGCSRVGIAGKQS